MAYPVSVHVEPCLIQRNRLTVAFRPILAIPHAILTGPVYFWHRTGSTGLLGAVTYFLAFVNWLVMTFGGRSIQGIRDFTLFYLRWRARSLAYMMMLADAYPPFGEGAYPIRLDVAEPHERDRLTIAFRLILAIPQVIVVALLAIAGCLISVAAWLAIVFTGAHPKPLFTFSEGLLRWALRVEAYVLLLVDDYPPFALEADAAVAGGQTPIAGATGA
jgi:hypothetical protein